MSAPCSDCGEEMYPWDDKNGGIEYTCPKCAFEDLPRHIMERFPQFRTSNICVHSLWKTECRACKMDEAGREDTQGLIRKDLLLEEKSIADIQFETKQAMLKFHKNS